MSFLERLKGYAHLEHRITNYARGEDGEDQCGGRMKPIRTTGPEGGAYIIGFQCEKCGDEIRVTEEHVDPPRD